MGRHKLVQRFYELLLRRVFGGNIADLEDWMAETALRARNGNIGIRDERVLDKVAELTELDRLSQEIASDPVLRVRFNPGGSSSKSFDLLVERTSGGTTTMERRVEVERVRDFPSKSRNLHSGALHGAEKAVVPAPNRVPTAESTAVLPAAPSGGHSFQEGANSKVFTPGTLDYEFRDSSGQVRATGNLSEDLEEDFTQNRASHPNVANLDVVNIVDDGGKLLGRLVRNGGTWSWTQ
jgi:hypothetical protein